MQNNLKAVKILEYRHLKNTSMEKWLIHTYIPAHFLNRINVSDHVSVFMLLTKIRKVLYDFYGTKRDKARSFADSRFTPLPRILKRGMISCGALAVVYGAVLRRFRIPTKFVHGRLERQRNDNRHAWLKIYSPRSRKWIPVDATSHDFKLRKGARQIKIYRDWLELKKDYKKGKF